VLVAHQLKMIIIEFVSYIKNKKLKVKII
jgi:hypothetical protein